MRPKDWVITALTLVVAGVAVLLGTYYFGARRAAALVPSHQLKIGDCIQEWWGGTVLPPGDEALKRFGDNCGRKFFDYAPDIPDGPRFKVAVGFPKEQAWAKGDRSIVCAAISKGERC